MFKLVPVIRPHNVHMQHSVLYSVAWLNFGTEDKSKNDTCLFVVVLIDHKSLNFAVAFLILLFYVYVY